MRRAPLSKPVPPLHKKIQKKVPSSQDKVCFLTPHRDALRYFGGVKTDTDSEGESFSKKARRVPSEGDDLGDEQSTKEIRIIHTMGPAKPLRKSAGRTKVGASQSKRSKFFIHLHIKDVLEAARNDDQDGLLYLNHALPVDDKEYNPFVFRRVSYSNIKKGCFLTVSKNGMIMGGDSQPVYYSLKQWEKQYEDYAKLLQFRTFKNFHLIKYLALWHKKVNRKRFVRRKNSLESRLLYIRPELRESIMKVRAICCAVAELSFFASEKQETMTLQRFLKTQIAYCNNTLKTLYEGRDIIKKLLEAAAHDDMSKMGFSVDDNSRHVSSIGEHQRGSKSSECLPRKFDPKISYADALRKKSECKKITSLLCLSDYLIQHALMELLHNSIDKFLHLMDTQVGFLPKDNSLFLHPDNKPFDEIIEEPRNHPSKNPKLSIILLLDNDCLEFEPNGKTWRTSFRYIVNMWLETVAKIKPLQSEDRFRAFTCPNIAGFQEDSMCGFGPKINETLKNDRVFDSKFTKLLGLLSMNFECLESYVKRFEIVRQKTVANINLDRTVITDETGLDNFKRMVLSYIEDGKMMSKIPLYQILGAFNLNLEYFREDAIPLVENLKELAQFTMLKLGVERVNEALAEVMNALEYLDMKPQTTVNYVEYLAYLDTLIPRMEEIGFEIDYLDELFSLMNDFNVEVNPGDAKRHKDLGYRFSDVQDAIERASASRPETVNGFNETVAKDIDNLMVDIATIHKKAAENWLTDVNSDKTEVTKTLNNLGTQLTALLESFEQYNNYQRLVKVPVTRLDPLLDVINEVKIRKLLWDSLDGWDKIENDWMSCDFEDLDPELMQQEINVFSKNIASITKSIGPNELVTMLKSRVDKMLSKLSVITTLRNPNLKLRHWMRIEEIIGYRFDPGKVITLNLFDELNVYDYEAALVEVSGQASSEAVLETLLKKVEDAWKSLEFVVLPYKDLKDVYILARVEEIQTVLDETSINLTTITSSKNVGPIKARVMDWLKNVDLFSKTLDVWMKCQTNWIYLEPIFAAPDIQRQLPAEAKLFSIVDKSWKEIMKNVAKNPLAMKAATSPGLYEEFLTNNDFLEQILKCLEAYLESKRVVFPRFYFLSNDELLEILAQTRNPHAVQPHLRKCFDAIARLEFGVRKAPGDDQAAGIATNDIKSMVSPEGEVVLLGKGLKARGNVEEWLGLVEASMFNTLWVLMKMCIKDYLSRPRVEWVLNHASQLILTVSQIMWAREVHGVLTDQTSIADALLSFEKKSFVDLNDLAALVRGTLTKLQRNVLGALITVDVHARDIITSLVQGKVREVTNFEWAKQLRYYWETRIDNCIARMATTRHVYGYEYLGASGRLVITPLTDKCYLCLMGALQLDLGGAPAGPAGTGKTETTKDLAKSLAIQCVVFNCSEGLDYKMMGRFFSGLAQSGAWCCFDEFNRIDIEVLSVIAQQLITIRNAKVAKVKRFMFEGREIKLVPSCAAFITMNPGYAGRTELPDNLKSVFRPMAMMVPDYGLIAEVVLYSEGFETSKILAEKMVLMYKLCSEQLSSQDHYDFGMRAVKSVLVMAGSLKRQNPDKKEDIVLIRALRDSNLPKFLAGDAILFEGILNDLFPEAVLPSPDYGEFQKSMEAALVELKLQPAPVTFLKTIQLYETMVVRWGVMTVGPTAGGKTTILRVLKETLSNLFANGSQNPQYRPVTMYTLNPKSVTMGELYGEVNLQTMEWRDGLLGMFVRSAANCTEERHQWVVCDGPVDAVWIENMNTVLDDNKMLCLANSERIKLTPWVHMVFEVQDLSQASPATVSRCGMVYLDPEELKWMPYVISWAQHFKAGERLTDFLYNTLIALFDEHVERGFSFMRKNCTFSLHQVEISKIATLCSLFGYLVSKSGSSTKYVDVGLAIRMFHQVFVFSYVWALGGNLTDFFRTNFEQFCKEEFKTMLTDIRFDLSKSLWDVFYDPADSKLKYWTDIVGKFVYNVNESFSNMIVPTVDMVRCGQLMKHLLDANHPVLLIGHTGVGKSAIAKEVLNELARSELWIPNALTFSAQTSSTKTQEMIEGKLEKKKRAVLGAPMGKRVVVFIDDVNMPRPEVYGAQPPIELLREFLNFGGMYDREKLIWKQLQGVVLCAACAPPGGGRNHMTPRFSRHFATFFVPSPSDASLTAIIKAILQGFLDSFIASIQSLCDGLVLAAITIYKRLAQDLLPIPAKSHYVFNLRDLSKCVQGILQASTDSIRSPHDMLRLFFHENLRVYHDRLVDTDDKSYFYRLLSSTCANVFHDPVLELPAKGPITLPPLLFGDFLNQQPVGSRIYQEISNVQKLKNVLEDFLADYNLLRGKDMKLIFFTDAFDHVCRLARVIRTEGGNGLLVGVGGMGKRSLTKLASHINGCRDFQIEVTSSYDYNAFHEDLRKIYFNAGAKFEDSVFIFSDTQIVLEEFLEDINNILNSGELSNLFEADEYEKVIIACRGPAKQANLNESQREVVYDFFISRVKLKLHLMLCMSPVGESFRRRCRMFPSLVNCCTINWFSSWPEEALISVAKSTFSETVSHQQADTLASICYTLHSSVDAETVRFYRELKRHCYVTPSSYLDLLNLFISIFKTKSDQVTYMKNRISNGQKKLFETNELVSVMQKQIVTMEPELREKSKATEQLMVSVAKEKTAADEVKQVVLVDEAAAKKIAAECQLLADDAQKELDQAMPAMEAAVKALEALNKNDINEIRVFNKPPHLVKYTLEAVCLLLGAKQDWASAKVVLGDGNFLKKLQDYDKNHISDVLLKKMKAFIDNPDFVPEVVATQSKACKSLCMWVRAIDSYAKVYRVVEPKRKKVEAVEKELNATMAVLRSKQQHLANVEAQIARLETRYSKSLQEKSNFEAEMALCSARLGRAFRLTSALADEGVRWSQVIVDLEEELAAVVGDSIVASGSVAYLGPFTSEFRSRLVLRWLSTVREKGVQVSKNFSLVHVLSDPYIVREWNRCGLPRNNISIENGIFVSKTSRWPLMIDPQEQALRWIQQMEMENNLKTVKMTDATFMRQLESAVRLGLPFLAVEAGETLDPSLNPIILKQIFVRGGQTLIRWGDMDMEYNHKFKLYITTKLPNPHYLPEICIQVTIVNFTVTPSGLEDQLLVDVVTNERPDLEDQRTELIERINKDKAQLLSIEDRILKLLFASKGNILDDEELIDTLNESKETSTVISARLAESEETEEKISVAREAYRPVAARGSNLYFVIALLADIDPMYQFSLKYFSMIFNSVIKRCPKMPTLEDRLSKLTDDVTLTVYSNVSRGLFEKDKLIFSFMLCLTILKEKKEITEDDWVFLLRGAVLSTDIPRKPDILSAVPNQTWQNICYLDSQKEDFKGLRLDVVNALTVSVGNFSMEIALAKDSTASLIHWNSRLNVFQRMMLIRALKEEKMIFAIREFIKVKMGMEYVESIIVNLHTLYEGTNKLTPLIFVLSSGSDPVDSFLKFASQTGNAEKVHLISLGQGQGPIAQRLIERGQNKGEWVFLQNCHLAGSWMPTLENILMSLSDKPGDVHNQFRLFMSSMPSNKFPVSILQNSVKVTNEPPRGIRANVRQAFLNMENDFFNDHPFDVKWRRMVFGLCFFHSVILERKKYGPLGWNIAYEFSESDRECSLLNLKLYCQNGKSGIPWEALIYITGEITYGGRVTDYWDQRTLKTILLEFFSEKTLVDGFRYLDSETYRCPESDDCTNIERYRLRIGDLPLIDEPGVFGMHENANIALQSKEVADILGTINSVQPQTSTERKGESTEDEATNIASSIGEKIVKHIDPSLVKDVLVKPDVKGRLPSLTTVLLHEVERFNKMLKVVHNSLADLQKAIKGTVVMSETLEGVHTAFLSNTVPKLWSKSSYPSLKSLGSWTRDLELRIDFIMTWLKCGLPQSFWLPGFFFPQGFITGVLQMHARKYNLPINELKTDFNVWPTVLSQERIYNYHTEAGKEVLEAYEGLSQPEDGMLVHGLFLDGARFDISSMRLEDANPGEINPPLPAIELIPTRMRPTITNRYECPLYKTSARAGTLSTTGHSTNFVISIYLPSAKPQSHWILRGTALLTQTTD